MGRRPNMGHFRPSCVRLVYFLRKTRYLFFFQSRSWCLKCGSCLVLFSEPYIYVETYAYDEVYVQLLMTSYVRTSDHIDSCGLVHLLVTGGLEIFPGRLIASSGNSSHQCVCILVVMIGMIHHCQCEVSYP